MLAAASAGYFINDWADIEEDAKSGRANAVKKFSTLTRLVITTSLITTALTSIYIVAGWSTPLYLAIVQVLFYIAYSVPPIRLKKYIAGILVSDALYAHVLPAAIVFMIAYPVHTKASLAYVLLLVLWQAFTGLRNIMLHHVADRKTDSISGATNITCSISALWLVRFINSKMWLTEIVLLLVFIFIINPYFLIVICATFLLRYYVVMYRWQHKRHSCSYYNSTYLFLNNYYEQYLPIIALVAAALLISPWYWGLLVPYTMLFPTYINTIYKDITTVFR